MTGRSYRASCWGLLVRPGSESEAGYNQAHEEEGTSPATRRQPKTNWAILTATQSTQADKASSFSPSTATIITLTLPAREHSEPVVH